MKEKITLEMFRIIKNQLQQIIDEYYKYNEEHKDDNEYNYDFVGMNKRYLDVQSQLYKYDLSDIPFEEWAGMMIMSNEEVADFSKTNANIDFNLVTCGGLFNFKGCNVKNLDKFTGDISPDFFDDEVIKKNSELFLSDIFSEKFKEKYYNCNIKISDLASLNNEQLNEIKQKNYKEHLARHRYHNYLFNIIDLEKVVQLYNYSEEEYDCISKLVDLNTFSFSLADETTNSEELFQIIKNSNILDLKKKCFDYVRNKIINSHKIIDLDEYPKMFINENQDIFLVNANIPSEVKERFFNRSLRISDLINYPDVFNNFPIDFFMSYDIHIVRTINEKYGLGKFQELVQKHTDVFSHLLYELDNFFKPGNDLESSFKNAIKKYFYNLSRDRFYENNPNIFTPPTWLSSINFKFIENITTIEELFQYDDDTILLNEHQRILLDALGINNIKTFEQETGFFTRKENEWAGDLDTFNTLCYFFNTEVLNKMKEEGIDFNDGKLSYDEFLNQFAHCLDYMRKTSFFKSNQNLDYSWIQGNFRDTHQEIFMDINAPEELKTAFYRNNITPDFLYNHREYIKYLVDKNLSNVVVSNMELYMPGMTGEDGKVYTSLYSFIDEYVSRYGNEKFLELCVKYGGIISKLKIYSFEEEIEDEKKIEELLRKTIYNEILKRNIFYSHLASIPEMTKEFPDIFVDFNNITSLSQEEKERLTNAFYRRELTFDDIRKHPELVNCLKNKNLEVAFGKMLRSGDPTFAFRSLNQSTYRSSSSNESNELIILKEIGNDKFLQLCAKYGRYLGLASEYLSKDVIDNFGEISIDEISQIIEDIICRESKLGNINYNPDDAPLFLREKHPELFLNEDAPEELKQYFYFYYNNYPMSFEVLQKHKEWLPFLKDKALVTSLLRNHFLKDELKKYFELFGEEKGIKLGINRAETVKEMMRAHKVELMKKWFDKTGGIFIPDFVVMQNFRLDEVDKFLTSGSNWSKLMKIKSFAKTQEAREAMLKLAYSFGTFDQDQRGFKKLQDLLTGLPKKIGADKGYIFDRLNHEIDLYCRRDIFYGDGELTSEEKEKAYNSMINYIKNHYFNVSFDTNTLVNFFETLKEEKVDIDFSKPIFSQIYRKNEDGTYSLTINYQSFPKSAEIIREILEKFRELPILTPDKAHQLFGGFELKYDADFREFLLANMDKIMENSDYVSLVASVQKQFNDIKTFNSNRTLTWELAISYVQTNKYENVNVGNEQVAEISAIAGYSQEEFNILQQIHNYGKQRVFSSIPRIEQKVEKTSGIYNYEILRLDDPLAMAIGTLTDCCQELNNCAEVCMEHSMVDKNGRVFVIKDEYGNIVAQSWVWRNKDVLCFDNIEIPDKTFTRAVKEHPELGRKGFTDDIFEIYRQAANDLMKVDEKVYKELLETGKITQEQYDGLRLGKVTVGMGYNDIAESLAQHSSLDKGTLARPLPFKEPVELSRGLYTNDSNTQYILEERENRKEYDGETFSVHNDDYVEYSDSNFTMKSLLSLEKLEIVTKEAPNYLETSISEYADTSHLVTELAGNYGLNPKTTRIIMHPNFAIIYDVNGNKLTIGDLLFNTKIDNGEQQMDIESKVVMQIRLALDQIATDKEIDVSALNEKQLKMYEKVTQLTNELDIERGVGHAR